MAKRRKKPIEFPPVPQKPETKPSKEEPTRIWPEKNPVIIPGKDPISPKPPDEIPPLKDE
jgi:hypothetical protein